MKPTQTLSAADGHCLQVIYREPPNVDARGGLVLIQEIFGLTPQLEALAMRFAARGYRVVVPALYDRLKPGKALQYDQVEEARKLVSQLQLEEVMLDIAAAGELARCEQGVAVAGYCWGGGIAYLAACELDIDCAVSFYGTRLPAYLGEEPQCPIQFHFGEQDQHIPLVDVEKVRIANPGQELHIYGEAGHAFANDARPSFHPPSAELAEHRMFRFIDDCWKRGNARNNRIL